MRLTNLVLAASAAGLASASPYPREVIPGKRGVSTKNTRRATSGFTWVGTSESGAEFGSAIPGTLGTDYTWPTTSKIQILREKGMNIFRVPFLMERLSPDSITGTLDSTYLGDLKSTVKFITDSGAYAVLDPHNYGRYSGSIISSTSDFKTFWKTVATEFADNDLVIFDTNNEYHDMDQTLVLNLNQAAINGIRAAGATTQYIFVEGNAYSGAWSWTDNNDNLSGLTDSEDKIVYEMHQYLDSDSSGTSETCVSTTIGKERLESATEWLKSNNKKGIIGEFAGGVNSDCETAVEGMLSYMNDNSDVWMGASWWSAGPWWGTYMYSLEPTDGTAYSTYLPILEKYFVSSSSSSSSSSKAASSSSSTTTSSTTTSAVAEKTTTAVEVTSTPNSQAKAPNPSTDSSSSPAPAVTPAAEPTLTSISVFVPQPTSTTFAVVPSSIKSSSTAPSASASASASASGGLVPQYYQCGGINWTGSTTCQSPYTCKHQNPYYYQCV